MFRLGACEAKDPRAGEPVGIAILGADFVDLLGGQQMHSLFRHPLLVLRGLQAKALSRGRVLRDSRRAITWMCGSTMLLINSPTPESQRRRSCAGQPFGLRSHLIFKCDAIAVPSWRQRVGTISVTSKDYAGIEVVPRGFEPLLPT
jgi:hypothetical protein